MAPSQAKRRPARRGPTKSPAPWEVMSVMERGRQKFWTPIGTAVRGDSGAFLVTLSALPLEGKLVLLPPKS